MTRITEVETTLVRGAEGPDARHHCFVFVHTSDGPVGIGEATAPGTERATEMAVHDLARHLRGEDPLDVEGLWDRVYNATAWNWGPVSMTALSGLEMALWDIVGKQYGAPVRDLLGGGRDRVPVYANGLVGGDSPAGYGEAAARVEERGFRMTKFMPFAEEGADSAWPSRAVRERGVERLAAVRAATGDAFEVAVELHGVHAPAVAVDLCERVAPYEPTFVEEPVPPENHDALRRIRDRVSVPIATGERLLTTFDYREFLAHPTAADVVQPDVNNCGGIAQLKKIAGMAAADYLPVVPHNSRGPVATAAAAHALATVPNALALEYFPDLPPWRGELTVGDERVVDGEYVVPDGPGLGVELDREALDRHPYEKADTAEYRYSKGFDRFW